MRKKLMLALAMSFVMIFGMAMPLSAVEAMNYGKSIDQIVDMINSIHGTDIRVEPCPLQRTSFENKVFYGQELQDLIAFLEDHAIQAAESNRRSQELWEQRTGIPLSEAELHTIEHPTERDIEINPFSGIQSFVSTRNGWSQSWIPITLQGIVNVPAGNVHRTFRQIDSISSFVRLTTSIIHVDQFTGESSRHAIIDSGRTAAVHVTGDWARFNAIAGVWSHVTYTVYTEFFASTP